jgi:alcohol dehydrogenase class IV
MTMQLPGSFSVATRVLSGLGAVAELPAALDSLGAHRLALLADAGAAMAGVLDVVRTGVRTNRIGTVVHVRPDPGVADVQYAAEQARAANCDVVLAVGGGSALGAAKAVAILLTNPGPITRYEGLATTPAMPAPTVAIPTTAGSGSEVSRVLVLHEPGRPTELIVRVNGGEPRVAILDARLLRNLPATPMTFAGLDALSHALEAQWALGATWFTTALARASARTILDLLPIAVTGARDEHNRRGDNDAVLQRLLEASCAANMACGNSGLGLVHALSGAPATRLPHGQQNGILLPSVAAFNEPVLDDHARALVAEIPQLYERLGFTPVFPPGTDAEAIVAASRNHPLRANNRRRACDEDLFALLADTGAHPQH